MNDKRAVFSWVMYDWANSAFAVIILGAVLPVFYQDVAAKNLADNVATSYWGYTQAIGMLVITIIAPLLGAIADYSDSRLRFLKVFACLGIVGSGLLFFVGEGGYILASFFFILAEIGYSGANVFYDSFLPTVAGGDRMDYVSSLGYSSGYLGGGLLLLLSLVAISKPAVFGLPNPLLATQLSFTAVAVWWLVFSLPAFLFLPHGQGKKRLAGVGEYMRVGIRRLSETLKTVRQYGELWKFLVAFWLYGDGIGTIISMAAIYGREIGISQTSLLGAFLMTQFIGVPFSVLFGKLGQRIGAKRGIMIALFVYLGITIKGYSLATATDFWILAGLVGVVQGGAQALSRSLYGAMIPKDKAAEFFSFFGISSKFAGIMGPFTFAFVGQLTGSSRMGILSIAAFFILGIALLSRVNVSKGYREAA